MKRSLAWIAATFIALNAQANDENLIVSSGNGGSPYLVVRTGNGPSTREPGLYRRDAATGWQLIFAADVLLDPKAGSLLGQLEFGTLTGRYESIAIVDGKVRIFSIQSKSDDPTSFIEIGGDSVSVRDVASNRQFKLPRIDKVEDVSVLTHMVDDDGIELVIVSVRTREFPVAGVTGITMGFAVDQQKCKDGKLLLETQPILISTEFVTPDQLYWAISRNVNEPGFVSSEFLNSLAQPRPHDSNVLKQWRSDLHASITMGMPEKYFRKRAQYPYVSAKTGHPVIEDLPSQDVALNNINGYQIYNPLNNQTKFVLHGRVDSETSLEDFQKLKAFVPGELAFDEEGFVLGESVRFDTVFDVIKTTDHKYFLVGKATSGSDHAETMLELLPTQPFHGEITKFAAYADFSSGLLFTSWESSDDEKLTCVHEIQSAKYPIRVTRETALVEEFFTSDQLKWRVRSYEVTERQKKDQDKMTIVGLDLFTPTDITQSHAYETIHKLTNPHVNVKACLEKNVPMSALEIFFPEPTRNMQVAPAISYVEYESSDTAGLGLKRTGIIAKTRGDKDGHEFIRGILTLPPLMNLESEVLFDQTYNTGISEDKTKSIQLVGLSGVTARDVKGSGFVEVFVIDNEHQDHIIFHSEILTDVIGFHADPKTKLGHFAGFAKLFSELPGKKIPIETLKSISIMKVVRPDPALKRNGMILGTATLEGYGTTVFEIPFEIKDNKIKSAGSSRTVIVSTELMPADEVISRLRLDHRDRLVFVNTPELDIADSNFECLIFDTHRPHRVGQHGPIVLKALDPKFKAGEIVEPGSWRVTDFGAMKDEERAHREKLRHAAEYAFDVFPIARETLDQAADHRVKPEHIIMVIPPSVKRYLTEYPLALWLRKENVGDLLWNNSNKDFRFMALPAPGSAPLEQRDVFENFESMRLAAKQGKRVAIVSTLDRVKTLGIPKVPDKGDDIGKYPRFLLRDESVQSVSISGITEGESKTDVSEAAPNLLYLLETEGRAVSIQQLAKESINPQIPIILLGTRAELDSLDLSPIENKIRLKDRFKVIEVGQPTFEMRVKLVLDHVFGMSAIQQIGYEVDLPTFTRSATATEESPFTHVARYIVNRSEPLAIDNSMDPFDSLNKVMNRLAIELSTNHEVRNQKKITRAFIDYTIAKVFPMPLSVENLPKDDPYRILSQRDFIRRWNLTGFHGQFGIKARMRDILMSPLLPSDGKNVPGSFMIFGEHGLGKSTLVDSLFLGTLKMKPYKVNGTSEDNRSANYLRLNLQEVIDPKTMSASEAEKASSTGTSMSLEKALTAFDGVLATSQGRAAIILDDVHRASDNVRGIFMSRLRALQDTRSYTVKDSNGRYQEYPTRNLWIGVIFNLTDSRERIKKFAKYEWMPTEEEWILATLSSDTQPLDRSSLARFGTRLNYVGFTPDAKGPKLREEVLKMAKSNLISSQFLQIVSPEVSQRIIGRFPKLNARDFSTAVARGLAALKPPSGGQACSIIVPRDLVDPNRLNDLSSHVFGGEEGIEVERFVLQNFQSVPVFGKDARGQVGLMHYFLDNFRNRAFYLALDAITNDSTIQSEVYFQKYLLLPLAQAFQRHMSLFQDPPMSQLLNVDSRWLGARGEFAAQAIRDELRALEIRSRAGNANRTPFPKVVLTNAGGGDLFLEDVSIPFSESEARVMLATQDKLQDVFEDFVYWLMRMHPNQSSEEWLASLQKGQIQAPTDLIKIKAQLTKVFEDYMQALGKTKPGELDAKTAYDYSRFYAVLMDQALHRLNWAKFTHTASALLERATNDLAFSQSPAVQKILFESGEREDRWSLFVPLDVNTLSGFIDNIPFIQENRDHENVAHERFKSKCSGWIRDLGRQT
jgi:hypothetical protein